jgi:2-polyprenyl-3-methyl-5-hydroxy-6-metoxy-1,4-benzoquinol methylase
MSAVEEKLAASLTASTTELVPYLPYLLQDLWEMGSSPTDILELIAGNTVVSAKTRVLDLGCGKGAVSIRLAQELGCSVKGIDLMPEFIAYARSKAQEYGVEAQCRFEVGDINESVKYERAYDIVILGAVGDVLGDSLETILKLSATVRPGGYIFIDDAYGADGSDVRYHSRDQWLGVFAAARVRLVAEKIVDPRDVVATNTFTQDHITKRADELAAMHPEKARMFEEYVKCQQAECDELENEMTGVTLLLQTL